MGKEQKKFEWVKRSFRMRKIERERSL